MSKKVYPKGSLVIKQGEKHKDMIVVSNGKLDRIRNIKGQNHMMEQAGKSLSLSISLS